MDIFVEQYVTHKVTMFVTEIQHLANIAHTQPPHLRCLRTDMPVDGPNCLALPRLEPLESVIRNVLLPSSVVVQRVLKV